MSCPQTASQRVRRSGCTAACPLTHRWIVLTQDGDAAREGTCAAWVAELVINGDATCAEDMLGKVHANGWEVDEEMVKHINAYLAILPADGQGRGVHADASILRGQRTTLAEP